MSPVPGDGAVYLNNPDLTKSPGAAIIRQFYDAVGNVIPNPDPASVWGGFAEFKTGKDLNAPYHQIVNSYTNTYTADLSSVNAKLDALNAQLKQQTKASVDAAQNQVQQIIQVGERRISTNAVPILGKLEAVTSGAMDFSALSDATVVALSTSIPWALDFIQTERLGQGNNLLNNIARATIDAPGAIVKGVGQSIGDLGRGLLEGIAAIVTKIEATLIDPIAALLTAILAAITSLPARTSDAVWEALVTDKEAAAPA